MKKPLVIVVVLLAMATRGGAQATRSSTRAYSFATDIGGHWVFDLSDEGRSATRYVLDLQQSDTSNAISGRIRPYGGTRPFGGTPDKQRVQPLTGRYDRETHAIAFTIAVESPKGPPQRMLFAGVHDWYSMSGAMVAADGNLWSWKASRNSIGAK